MNRQATVTLLVVLVAFCVSMTNAQEMTEEQKQEIMRQLRPLVEKLRNRMASFLSRDQLAMMDEFMGNPDLTIEQAQELYQTLQSSMTPGQQEQGQAAVEEFKKDVENLGKESKKEVDKKVEHKDSVRVKDKPHVKKEEEEKREEKKDEAKEEKQDEKQGAKTFTAFGSIAIVAALTVF